MSLIRTVAQARNPRYTNPSHTIIDIEVDFNELDYDWVPFTCMDNPYDEPHVSDIFKRAVSGEWGEVAAFVPPSDVTGDTARKDVKLDCARVLIEINEKKSTPQYLIASQEDRDALQSAEDALNDLIANVDSMDVSYIWNNEKEGHDLVGATIPALPDVNF